MKALPLILGLALISSCHTAKQTSWSENTSAATIDGMHAECTHDLRLHTSADSVRWWWRADSVVTPNGTTIYAPEAGAAIVAPAIDAAASDSATIDTASSSALSSHKETDTQSEVTAITQPPSLWWLLVLAVAIAIALYFWKSYRNK